MDHYTAYSTAELAEIYDAAYDDSADRAFWERIVSAAPEGTVLEVGCGTGRVALPLARAGRGVVGLDLSPHMLDVFRRKLEHEPADVRDRVDLVCGDMTSFDLGQRFAAILSTFNGFHHLRTVDQQLACLDVCRRHLAPGGRLVLDLANPDPAPASTVAGSPAPDLPTPSGQEPEPRSETVPWTDGRSVRRSLELLGYDRTLQCDDCEVHYEVLAADGNVLAELRETFPLRFIYRYELVHLLARSGFEIVEWYGDYDFSPFAEESLGMIVVAEATEPQSPRGRSDADG